MAATGKSVVTMLKNAVVSQAKNKQTATVCCICKNTVGMTEHGRCECLLAKRLPLDFLVLSFYVTVPCSSR